MLKNIHFTLFIILLLITHLFSSTLKADEKSQNPDYRISKTLEMTVNSSINPATFNYLKMGFERASKEGFNLIIIKLNTPGGLVSTTKEILTLFGSSNIPVIVWIAPEGASATSAGAIIASGSHLLYMSNGTNIGAATPINMGGDIEQKDLRKKAVNDLVALVKSLSETRNRNGELFAEMVKNASSFTAKDANEKNLINGIANSNEELFELIKGESINLKGKNIKLIIKNNQIVEHEMDLGQKILNIFANPSMAYILFIIGAALIYLELQAPGGFVAGALGALSLILAGIGFQVLPLNWGAFGLIIVAFVLFVAEAYITSYGILSLAGIGALIVGSLFLFRTDNAYMKMSTSVIISTALGIGVFLAIVAYLIVKDAFSKRPKDFFTHKGKKGLVVEKLPKESEEYHLYRVKISGEIWKARSKQEIEINKECTVLEQDKESLLLTVE